MVSINTSQIFVLIIVFTIFNTMFWTFINDDNRDRSKRDPSHRKHQRRFPKVIRAILLIPPVTLVIFVSEGIWMVVKSFYKGIADYFKD